MTPEAYENVLRAIAVTEDTPPRNVAECGACHFRWDDTMSTTLTPTPSGRCPNEYNHGPVPGYTSKAARLLQLQSAGKPAITAIETPEDALDALEEFARAQAGTPGGQKHATYLAAIVRGALRERK